MAAVLKNDRPNLTEAGVRRLTRTIVDDFTKAVRVGDPALGEEALRQIIKNEHLLSWRPAMRAVSRVRLCSPEFRRWFLNTWVDRGDYIRLRVDHDLVLADALRVLLPPYRGPARTLYRGEGAENRRNRTYGLSWTRDADAARGFALGTWSETAGGSVLLKALAPPEAIICAIPRRSDRYAEGEYLLDRRLLGKVTVMERFSQAEG